MKPIEIDMEIRRQGSPIVNDAWLWDYSEKFALVEVDLRSKWCEVKHSSGTLLGIGATDHSCHLKEDIDRSLETEILFPRFVSTGWNTGWNLWSCDLSRYTLRICFQKIED